MARRSIASDVVVVALALLLLGDSFIDWLGEHASVGPDEVLLTWNAWGSTLCAIAVVVGVVALLPAALRLGGLNVPRGIIAALGALAFGLVLVKLVVGPHIDTGGFDVDIDETRELGIYVGLTLTAGIAATGLLQLLDRKDVDPS